MEQIKFVKKQGREILEIAKDFAALRIAVFKDFPYLYAGTLEYELNYVQTYSNSKNAFLFAIYDEEKMIGATTCIPLSEETENVQKPFLEAGYDISSIFYFGESLLLKNYRGRGYGHLFFDEREKFASSFENIEWTTFCAVNRPENHHLKPKKYLPNDVFWTKRGYQKQPEMYCSMSWQDVDEPVETEKTLTFWIKKIEK